MNLKIFILILVFIPYLSFAECIITPPRGPSFIDIAIHQRPENIKPRDFCVLRSMGYIAARLSLDSEKHRSLVFRIGDEGAIDFSEAEKKERCYFRVNSDLANDSGNMIFSSQYKNICGSSKNFCFYPMYAVQTQNLLDLLFQNSSPLSQAIQIDCPSNDLLS